MARYVAVPTHSWASESHTPEMRPTCDVYETELVAVKTGLLDASGTPLYRMPERDPIGFRVVKRNGRT